jgi:electron transport complex protein RnfD
MTDLTLGNAQPVEAVDPPVRSDVGVARFFLMHVLAIVLPITAGVILYGWRALAAIGLVVASMLVSLLVWKKIGRRGRRMNLPYSIWLSVLLAVMLPAHLATSSYPSAPAPHVWAILAGAGLSLTILMWLFGGAGSGRVHPALVIYLLLVVLFQSFLEPHFVLQRGRIGTGDILNVPTAESLEAREAAVRKEAWTKFQWAEGGDAIYAEPASSKLVSYTTGSEPPDRAALSLEELIRDKMPPLEDLIVGGQPAAIGLGSCVAVIMGGLYLLYRGLIDYRIPLFMCLAAYASFLLLPIPVTITERSRHWQSLVLSKLSVGWPTAITFVNYELMAGPILFTAFFIATSAEVRPMTRRGRTIFAILVGILAAALQLYLDVSYGAYLALLIVSLITPLLDWWFRPKPLV